MIVLSVRRCRQPENLHPIDDRTQAARCMPRLAVWCAFTMLGNSELIRLMFEQPVRPNSNVYILATMLNRRYISFEPRERAAHYTPATRIYQSVASSMPMLNFKHNFN